MTSLVTGAAGKVARNVVTGLPAAGHAVRATSRSPGEPSCPRTSRSCTLTSPTPESCGRPFGVSPASVRQAPAGPLLNTARAFRSGAAFRPAPGTRSGWLRQGGAGQSTVTVTTETVWEPVLVT
jgi:hypothetical protein